jgi:hypothetical protein
MDTLKIEKAVSDIIESASLIQWFLQKGKSEGVIRHFDVLKVYVNELDKAIHDEC